MDTLSYLTLRQLEDGETVNHTASIGGNINVDLGPDGHVIGIEMIGGVVGAAELVQVIRRMRWQP